jgi:hypothetical protein
VNFFGEVGMTISGGCFCGALRFQIDAGEYLTANCHCTMCRRVHAAPYVTWLVVPVARFRYTAGEPNELRSSSDGSRYFCSRCGTHVACVNASHPDVIDVTLGSLDAPEAFAPALDAFADTRLPWVRALDEA